MTDAMKGKKIILFKSMLNSFLAIIQATIDVAETIKWPSDAPYTPFQIENKGIISQLAAVHIIISLNDNLILPTELNAFTKGEVTDAKAVFPM